MKDVSMKELKNTATQMRMKVVDMIYKAKSGHQVAHYQQQIL